MKDAAGNLWKYDYDLRGRKIREQTPDKGVTTYTYNDLDQVVSSTDARGVTQTISYDKLGRRTAITADGKLVDEWKYDTIKPGSLTSATRYVNGQPYTLQYTSYDDAGRPTGQQLVLPASEGKLSGTYPTTTTYTADGQPATVKLPGVGGLPEETLTYTYDKRSRPTTLTGSDHYVTEAEYTPYGETSRIRMERGDNWAEQLFDFELGTHRLKSAGFVSPNGLESYLQYSYDAAGNITKITDDPTTVDNANETQCLNYDYYRRLTQAWTPAGGDCAAAPNKDTLGGPAPYWHNWTFDATGNRTSETRTTPAGATVSTYEYPAAGQARPHAAQKVVTTGPGVNKTDQYAYDEMGNLKTRTVDGKTENLSWTTDGKLDTVASTGQSTSNVYDTNGDLVLRKDATGTTLVLGDTEVLLKPDGSTLGTRYYAFGDQKVAVRTGATKLTWMSSDNHGTMNVSVDADTLATTRRRMTPYGELRGAAPAAWPGQRGFVGGLQDASTGLVQLGARTYDPKLGKFVSVDPVVDVNDPQQLNSYAYSNNSPVTFSDADGQRYVTETVKTLRTIVKVVFKRITELKETIERKRVFVRVLTIIQSVFRALGWNAMAEILGYWITVEIKKMVRIYRTIKELVKVQQWATVQLKRWVNDAESKQLDQMMKQSTDILANAARHVADAVSSWAATQRRANTQGAGGGEGAQTMGGPQLISFHQQGPTADPPLDDTDPPQPWWFKWLKRVGTAGGVAVGGAACVELGPGAFACGATGGAIADGIFDGLWDNFTETPKEKHDLDEANRKRKDFLKYCHTYNGC